MFLTPDEKHVGKENFFAAVGSPNVERTREKVSSQEFLRKAIKQAQER